MMKHLLRRTLVICLIASSWFAVNAQDPSEGITEMGDTLVIQTTYNGSILNALNNWILWDHDGDYANSPKHKVYKLLRNNVYVVQTSTNINGRLSLVADKPDKDNKPPQFLLMNDGENAFPWVVLVGGPFTLKNISFSALNATTKSNDAWQHLVHHTAGDGSTYIDGCYFENWNANLIKVTNGGNRFYLTNNFFSDGGAGWPSNWQGNFLNSEDKLLDSLVMQNNTFINSPGQFLNIRKQMTKYVDISHNTLINNGGYPFFTTFWTNATIKNNLFYNILSIGINEPSSRPQDPDGQIFSIINIDTLANEFSMADPTWLEKEAERSLVVKNNYIGWDEEVEAVWAGRDSLSAPIWMNERTIAMFADDTNYPLLVEENNSTKAEVGLPTFETPIPTTGDMVKWLDEGVWGSPQTAGLLFVWEPADAEVPNNDLDWPPLEDLRITKAGFVGDDGKPMGDLNWYPEYAERWDMSGWGRDNDPLNISKHTIAGSGIEISNFPNPFENETNFSISLNKAEDINVAVYDNLGRNIATLYHGKKAAGQHLILWNGMSNTGGDVPSGIYFLRVSTNSEAITHKLMKF
jgi:hypothetical protein